MYGTHHKTGKKIRLLQYSTGTWRDKKTLVWLSPSDDLTVQWNKYDVGVVGSTTYEAMKDKIDIDIVISEDPQWIRENFKEVRLIFASKATLDIIGLPFFEENKISNILCLDELLSMYPFLEKGWDGTPNDACVLVALVLRFGFTFPLEETDRNLFALVVGKELLVPPQLYFITQYYRSKTKRTKEIDHCLQKNIDNNFIDKIILLNEMHYDLPESSKIEQIVIGKRLYYEHIIRYIQTLPDNIIVVFANADIYLDDTIRQIWSTNVENKFFALLRYDIVDGKSTIFGPRADSQDCWIVSSTSVNKRSWKYEDFNFSFGVSGCDNAITLEMLRMKFLVVNPALSIKTHHVHTSDIRSYNKDDIVEKDVYLYITPTGLQDMEAIVQIKEPYDTCKLEGFDRPITCAKAETYCKMLEKQKRYMFDVGKNTFEERIVPIYNYKNIFQTSCGLIFDYNKIYVGPSKIATDYWSKSNLSTLSPSLPTKKSFIAPLPENVSSNLEDYLLYYLPKILMMRKLYGQGDFWVPKQFVEPLSVFQWDQRPQIVSHDSRAVLYAKNAYVWLASDNLEVSKEEISALRSLLPYVENTSEEVTVYMDGTYINKVFIDQLELRYSVKVIYPDTSFDRKIAILQSTSLLISFTTLSKLLWALKPGSKFIDIQYEMELNGEAQHLAAACGLDHIIHLVPKGAMSANVRAKIFDSLDKPILPSIEINTVAQPLHTIYVPSEQKGFFAHAGDSFREVIDMWAERKYIKKVYGPNKNVWLNGIGEILLYDRPNYDWIKTAGADEQIWKKALFGNPKPIGPNSFAWSFWARRPRLLEAMLDKKVERTKGIVFYGCVENAVQKANRTKHDWSSCCEYILSDKPQYTQQEYLDNLAKACYGLCLAGYGKKCHREVECMALGTVPVCAPEVDMDSYANPPVEGVHYIRVCSPEDVEKIKKISYEQWQTMSDACRLWYKTNCSVDGFWNLTKNFLKN